MIMIVKSSLNFTRNVLLMLGALFWLAVSGVGVTMGPAWNKAQAQEMANQTEMQTRDACDRLKFAADNPNYAACVSVLSEVRQLREAQIKRTELGLL
jgi:hypothetical protein